MSCKESIEKQSIKAIILVGPRDFGRCPLASHLPTALWPVAGKPVMERLLSHLADQGVRQAVVCSTGEGSLLGQYIHTDDRLELEFLDDSLPVGTAGCIRLAAGDTRDTLLMIFPASVVCPPDIDVLISAHREGESDLTVMLNPCCGNGRNAGQASGIYVCDTDLLEHIPEAGYFDIKEGLIPEMLLGRRTVHAATLPKHAGNFRDRHGYLYAVANYLETAAKLSRELDRRGGVDAQNVWVAADAKVDPEARVCGSVAVMGGSTVSSGAVILGPTIIGRNVTVGRDSVVTNSVLWDGAHVGSNCRVQRCVVDCRASVADGVVVEEESIACKSRGIFNRSVDCVAAAANRSADKLQPQIDKIWNKLPSRVRSERRRIPTFLAAGLVSITFIWNYRAGLADLWDLWQKSDEYSSGLLVPFLAVYVLWSRRHDIAKCSIRPSLWGLVAFAVAHTVRILGLFLMYSSAERLSIVMSVAAMVLLLFGWQVFRKVFSILLFLCLMLPWPNIVQYYIGLHLQRYATSSAVFCLETIGYEIMREGNIIHIGDASVAVAEACNGLRMITAFFVISGLVALLVKRAWWEKLIILISSLPIALLCNTVRLATTAVLFTVLEGEHWEKIFHDFGGYAMMPLALAAVVGELWLLTKLTTLPDPEEAIIVVRRG
ncbi:MAG: exosortase [Planctomycetota bacterium]